MEKEWHVTVTFKDGMDVSYRFNGSEEEACSDAYHTFPEGSIEEVLIQGPSHEDKVINTLDIEECAS